MIVTLTPNPSVDRTIELGALTRGDVHRAISSRVEAGGKGVNVSRCLSAQEVDTVAVLPVGGAEGAQLRDLLAASAFSVVAVPVSGATRSNVTLVEPDGTTTKINEPGPEPSLQEVQAMADRVADLATSASWVALCGSLPPAVPGRFYADLIDRLHEQGAKVAVDTSGAALAAAVAARPDMIKPNAAELAELIETDSATIADVVAHAESLRANGVGAVLVSLGSAGAVLVDDSGVHRACASPVEVRSTVAAGDATLAGYLTAVTRHAASAEALRTAVAFGTAAVTLPGSATPGRGDVRLGQVWVETNPDLSPQLEGAST